MFNKKQKITLGVDNQEISDKELSGTILAHKEISDSVKSAYQFSHSDIKMEFLAKRVIAEAKSTKKYSLLEKLKLVWSNTFNVHRLAWSAALSIVVIASFSFVLLKNNSSESQELESFVIFQTPEGDSIVQYFNPYNNYKLLTSEEKSVSLNQKYVVNFNKNSSLIIIPQKGKAGRLKIKLQWCLPGKKKWEKTLFFKKNSKTLIGGPKFKKEGNYLLSLEIK